MVGPTPSILCVLHVFYISVHQMALFTMLSVFNFFLCLPRYKRRRAKPFPESVTVSPQPTLQKFHAEPEPLPTPIHLIPGDLATSKVPAVAVDESDMHDVLGAIFGSGQYEVALNRDIYLITASRKLTRVCGDFSPWQNVKRF